MNKYSFFDVKEILNDMVCNNIEPELSLYINGKEYMIICYKDKCSFQKCENGDKTYEIFYKTLDELYNSVTIDNILLKRDWDNILQFECIDYEWYSGKCF